MTHSIDPDDLARVEPWLRGPYYNFFSGREVLVPVRNVNRAKRVYMETLNCRLVSESEIEVRIDVGPHGVRFVLKLACRGEWPASIVFPAGCHTLCGGGTRALYEHFQKTGVTFAEAFREDENGLGKFTIEDPDGHTISFLGTP